MGGRRCGGGGRGRLYTYRYTVTTRTTCIKMGNGESDFNVSLIVRDKVTRQCPQTTTFFKRKESRSGIEPRSFRLPAYRLTARPNLSPSNFFSTPQLSSTSPLPTTTTTTTTTTTPRSKLLLQILSYHILHLPPPPPPAPLPIFSLLLHHLRVERK